MTEYLLFRLYGPMASWGEIAVGESRHSAVHPSRSALVGLLGAALGLRRDEDAAQQALIDGYRFAMKVESAGTPLRDYHTVQAPPARKNVVYRTRARELETRQVLETLLSMREYRCDALAVVAVEALVAARWTLGELAGALRRPVFPLYLGRKSCPPALPLAPQMVQAANLREAFAARQRSLLALVREFGETDTDWPAREDVRALRLRRDTVRYCWEDGMEAGMEPDMQTVRIDQPLSRRRWQFAPRRESVHFERGGER
ncbi:MAG TPA: type I-E CRISPR-associated protein Cas5/CasD [Acidobacteriaceae bacterium]|nr:type I-E CRISPR-associated protein Cas5/CasD [Acidobacteriaceae bacterium]